jgi:hypothetical protein
MTGIFFTGRSELDSLLISRVSTSCISTRRFSTGMTVWCVWDTMNIGPGRCAARRTSGAFCR